MGGGGGGGAAVPSASAAPAEGKQQGAGDPRAEALRCPRCDSANTKFCYYNNYSMAQPRHFCKACKRYWTRGGTLRNVPVGGGCRKNKRSRGGGGSGGKHCAGGGSAAAASATVGAGPATAPASVSLSLPPLPSLTSALGLPGSSLASLFLGGSGDHVSLFQAMQAVPGDAAGFELQQPQVDHLLGLGYGGSCGGVAQMQVKPWQQLQEAGGVMDAYFGPLLAGSAVPGLEELHMCKEVKVEDAGDQHKAAPAVEHWELPSCDAAIASADALISSINPAGSNTPVAPASASLMYWNSGATAWPDIGNCGSSVAPLF